MQLPNIQVNMASKIKLVMLATQVTSPLVPTDWLSQEENHEEPRCPASSQKSSVGAGDIGLADNLILFSDNKCLPESLGISKFNERDGLESTFGKHSVSSTPYTISS